MLQDEIYTILFGKTYIALSVFAHASWVSCAFTYASSSIVKVVYKTLQADVVLVNLDLYGRR